jgi:hypothetical protein
VLAEVMNWIPGSTIPAWASTRQDAHTCGLSDAEIDAGCSAVARMLCCGEAIERQGELYFFAASELRVGHGDIVEVRLGSGSGSDSPLNEAVRVRQRSGDEPPTCRWTAAGDHQVLHCDGIEQQGWGADGTHGEWVRLP